VGVAWVLVGAVPHGVGGGGPPRRRWSRVAKIATTTSPMITSGNGKPQPQLSLKNGLPNTIISEIAAVTISTILRMSAFSSTGARSSPSSGTKSQMTP
jgi:hypothetical protein